MAKKKYSHKQIRKSIKKDELRDLIDKTALYVKQHTENILISAVIVVLVVVLIPLYFNNRQENERRAGRLLNQAVGYSLQPVAGDSQDLGPEAFRTLDEKYKKVQQSFAEISATYKGTHAAYMARLGEADATFYTGEYEKAKAIYEELLQNEKTPALRGTMREKIAACQENLGQWQDALGTYQSLLAQSGGYFNQRSVNMGMARCYSALGQKDKAAEIYREEMGKEPGSYWAEVARQSLAEK